MANMLKPRKNQERRFHVVHLLEAIPEEKFEVEHLGSTPMTLSVKRSLLALRGHLYEDDPNKHISEI
jgi:hypothetical protein